MTDAEKMSQDFKTLPFAFFYAKHLLREFKKQKQFELENPCFANSVVLKDGVPYKHPCQIKKLEFFLKENGVDFE